MAIQDALLLFTGASTGVGNSDGKTDSPTTGTQNSSNVVDLGITNGIPSSTNGGGARDIGAGDKPALKLDVIVTTPFTVGTSLQITLSGAPDSGTGTEGAYTIMWTSPVFVEAALTLGVNLANVDIPRQVAGQPMPRFLKLTYITVGTHTLGKIEGWIALDEQEHPGVNSGIMSGYPAGINIAN